MKFFSRLRVRFFVEFLKNFVKNTWNQITGFIDLIGIICLFLPILNNYVLYFLIIFTALSFLGVSTYILVKKKHRVLTTPEKIYLEHTYNINAIALSPNERYLASCSGDNFVILWDIQKSKPIFRMQHPVWVSNIVFSPENKYLYTLNGTAGTINQWDLESKKKVYSKPWFPKLARETTPPKTRGLSISSDGKRMVISSEKGSFVYFDPTDIHYFCYPIKISNTELRKALLFNDNIFLSSSAGELFIINTSDNSKPWPVDLLYKDENDEMVRGMEINKKNNSLAFTNSDGCLNIINLRNKERSLKEAHNGHAVAVCFNESGKFLATGGQDNIIRLWKIKNGKIRKLFEINGHSDTVTSLVFDSKNRLYSASRDKSIKVWNLKGLE